MEFRETSLPGVFLISLELLEDERGFFSRTFCRETFARHGLNPHLEQCNLSFNRKKGTLRGMHYQEAPAREAKLVRCLRGAIYDVILDVRPGSATWGRWEGFILSEESRQMLYVPEGMAHGFLTLCDQTEVFYQMSEKFLPALARGIRWDDPAFGITWPEPVAVISEKDQHYPLVNP